MKQKLISIGLALGLGISVGSYKAHAAIFQSLKFINGYTLFLTNNTTTAYAANYAQYIAPNGNLNVANTSTSTVPVIYLSGVLSPWFPTIPTNANAVIYYTNTPVVNTNTTLGAAWVDVPLYADANGNASAANLSVALACTSVAGTNQATFLFTKIPAPGYPVTREVNGDNITMTIACAGITNTVATTNLLGWMTGSEWGVRLRHIIVANSTTNDFIKVNDISLNGYIP